MAGDDSFVSWDNGLSNVGNAVSINGTVAARVRCQSAAKVVSATTSVTYTGTMDFSQTWSIALATFKSAAAATIINGSSASLTLSGSQGSVIIGNTINGTAASVTLTPAQGSVITSLISEVTGQRNTANSGANTAIFTYPGTPTEGNLLIACLAWRGNATISSAPSGWSLATAGGDNTGIDSAIYYKIAGASEPTGHTFTFSAAIRKACAAFEFSGVTTPDKFNSNIGSGTSGTTGATGVLSSADELVIALFSNQVSTETWSAHDNGLTEIAEIASADVTAANNANISVASKVTTVTDSINYGATLSLSRVWSAAVATFMAGSGGTTVTGIPATLSLAGQTGVVIIGNTMTGSIAAITLTGQSGTVIIGNTINSVSASLTLTPSSGSVSIGNTIPGIARALVLAGQSGAVSIGNTINGSSAAVILSPQAGTVHIGNTITGVVANIAITGQQGSVHIGNVLDGTAATITITGAQGSVLLGDAISGSIAEITLTAVTGYPILGTTQPVRYIRDYLNGASGNGASYWVEIQAYDATGTNIAAGKTVTANFTPGDGTLSLITNGDTNTNNYVSSFESNARVTVDLGATYDIASVTVWHYNGDNRTFYGTKTETSVDGITWTQIFNSTVSGEYPEQTGGRNYLTLPEPSPNTNQLSSVIPAYTLDAGSWDDYISTAFIADSHAVINPNSGPGTVVNSTIASYVDSYHTAGGKILGYVSSSYAGTLNTARTVAAVKADIDTYIALYAIDGFFIDEFTSADTTDNVNYYAEVYAYIKSLGAYSVCGNVGMAPAEIYASAPLADNLVVFEGTPSSLANFVMPVWTDKYSSSYFSWIVHSVSGANEAASIVTRARNENTHFVFVTDDIESNPYDLAPSYWEQFAYTLVGANTIDGTAASLSLSGDQGTIVLGNTVDGQTAVISLQPQAGQVLSGNAINGTAGQIQLSGVQGFLLTNNFVDGISASLVLYGQVGSVSIGNTLNSNLASIALSAPIGTVSIGNTISGAVAELIVQPVSGIVVTGNAIIGQVATITLQPQVGEVSTGNTLIGIPASLSLSGNQGTAQISTVVNGAAGAITLSSNSGEVSQGNTLSGSIGQITISGVTGSVGAGNVVNGSEAALNLIPTPGELVTGIQVNGISQNISLTGIPGEASIGNTIDGVPAGMSFEAQHGIVINGNFINGTIDQLELKGITGSVHTSFEFTGIPADLRFTAPAGDIIAGTVSVSSFSITAKDAYFGFSARDSTLEFQAKDAHHRITATDSNLSINAKDSELSLGASE